MSRKALSTIDPHGPLDEARGELSDEALADAIRDGDASAFDELYRRHAREAARSYAWSILRSDEDAEDAAADAFANLLSALNRQGGPRQLFRPYLLACVRNSCARRQRQRYGYVSMSDRDAAAVDARPADDTSESEIAAKAFACLSDRWREVLWMAEVQHVDVATIADMFASSVPATSAMLHRARQAFAEAYLSQHLQKASGPMCEKLAPKLARYVRGTAGAMSSRQIEAHVVSCLACATAVKELTDVNSSLRSLTPPWYGAAGAGGVGTALVNAGGSAGILAGAAIGWVAKAAIVAVLGAAPILTADTYRSAHISPPRSTSAVLARAQPVSRSATGAVLATVVPAGPSPTTGPVVTVASIGSGVSVDVTAPPMSPPPSDGSLPGAAAGGVSEEIEAAGLTTPSPPVSTSGSVSLPTVTLPPVSLPAVQVVAGVIAEVTLPPLLEPGTDVLAQVVVGGDVSTVPQDAVTISAAVPSVVPAVVPEVHVECVFVLFAPPCCT